MGLNDSWSLLRQDLLEVVSGELAIAEDGGLLVDGWRDATSSKLHGLHLVKDAIDEVDDLPAVDVGFSLLIFSSSQGRSQSACWSLDDLGREIEHWNTI